MTEEALQSELTRYAEKKNREKKQQHQNYLLCSLLLVEGTHQKTRRTGVRTNTLTKRIKVGNIRCKTNEKIKHNSEIKKSTHFLGTVCVYVRAPLTALRCYFLLPCSFQFSLSLLITIVVFIRRVYLFFFFVSSGFSPHTGSPSFFQFH